MNYFHESNVLFFSVKVRASGVAQFQDVEVGHMKFTQIEKKMSI